MLPYQWRNKSALSPKRCTSTSGESNPRSLCKCHQCNSHIPSWLSQCPPAWQANRLMHQLQVAQNSAAHCLTKTCYRQHITPVLQQLHLLPVKQRVIFKVLKTIHKSLHSSTVPTYMSELCSVYQPHRALRSSSDQWKLVVKKSSNKYGARAINILGAQLRNDLPLELR